jgi:prephenate dehydrogenase
MTVGILGLGLIGGSLARAYSLEGHRVLCFDRDEQMLSFAMLAGAVESPLTSDNISECDLILLAIYPEGSAAWLEQNAHHIAKGTLVIDCCGVKTQICRRCFPIANYYGFTFIGGHPMAGTQFSGFKYSRANLFEGAPMVLVPDRYDDPELLDRAKKALAPCHFGSFSVTTAEDHDRMIAFTSQMPHIVSNAFIKSPTALEHRGFSAGSYKDLTRVAWLNASMWSELFLDNREHLLRELDVLINNLSKYRDAISQADEQMLVALLEEGKRRKEEVDG